MESERERLIDKIDDILYSVQYSENINLNAEIKRIADFILTDRRRCLDEVEKALKEIKAILDNPQWGKWQYMEGTSVYADIGSGIILIDEALAKIQELSGGEE